MNMHAVGEVQAYGPVDDALIRERAHRQPKVKSDVKNKICIQKN